jgi:hypothetical protein
MEKDDFDLRFYRPYLFSCSMENVLQPPLLIVSNGVWPAYTHGRMDISLM